MNKRMRIFTEKELGELHLSMLREVGAQIGVKAPTALSKGDLIKEILDIQRGVSDPVAPSGRGAPRKTMPRPSRSPSPFRPKRPWRRR